MGTSLPAPPTLPSLLTPSTTLVDPVATPHHVDGRIRPKQEEGKQGSALEKQALALPTPLPRHCRFWVAGTRETLGQPLSTLSIQWPPLQTPWLCLATSPSQPGDLRCSSCPSTAPVPPSLLGQSRE